MASANMSHGSDYSTSSLWQRTLGFRGDALDGFRVSLAESYKTFRRQVEPIANDVALSVPNYTAHDISHCDSLWDTASLLIGPEYPINPLEAFVLGGAFLIHDLAMGLSAYSESLADMIESVAVKDLAARMYPADCESIIDEGVRTAESNPTWDGITDRRLKQLLTLHMRNRHAAEASKVLDRQWTTTDGKRFYLLSDTDLRFTYAETIGLLGKSHWVDVNDLPSLFPQGIIGAAPKMPHDWTVDPLKLACILRLADAAQIDQRRADPLHTPHRRPQDESKMHWTFQERMQIPDVDSRRLRYTAQPSFAIESSGAWWLAYETVQMIDRELRLVDALCADHGRPRFEASAVAGIESPERFAKYVPTDGWRPIDARPKIGDSISLISRLGGSTLYGDDDQAPLRELIANAMDATKARRKVRPKARIRPITLSFHSTDSNDVVEVRDFGLGMSSAEMVSNLCDFGRSGWKSTGLSELFPGLLSSGFSPTGQFGIGFFSVFMMGSKVRVTSRSMLEAPRDTHILEFDGLGARPLLRRASTDEQLDEPGTAVSITCAIPFYEIGGLFEDQWYCDIDDIDSLVPFVKRLVVMADEDLDVYSVDSGETRRVISSDAWMEMPLVELLDAVSPTMELGADTGSAEIIRRGFEAMVSPILRSNGQIVGRLGLDIVGLSSSVSDVSYHIATGAQFAGGFFASFFQGLSGVLSGDPLVARRDEVRAGLTLHEVLTWFDDQIERALRVDAHPYCLLKIQAAGLELGRVSESLPITFSKNGVVHLSDFRSFCAANDRFYVLQLSPRNFRLGEVEYEGIEASSRRDFCVLDEGVFTVVGSDIDWDPLFANSQSIVQGADASRPVCEDLAECSSYHQRWWRLNFNSPTGELIRLAAIAWGVSVSTVVSSTKNRRAIGDDDDRIDLTSLSGKRIPIDALEVVRPA